jgi:YVTN family beta-propeller protein
VIDGATNDTATVVAGTSPSAVAVNPVTNRIYIANWNSANVTVIDGATNATATVAAGANPSAVAVNPVTNKIYVANQSSASVTVIDGATNATATVAAGTSSYAVAVNPVTNKTYVANHGSANVTVIDEAQVYDTGVRVEIDTLSGNATYQAQPDLAGKGVNRWSPNKTNILGVISNWMANHNAWNWADLSTGKAWSDSVRWQFRWGTDSLIWGENYVNILPLEVMAATSNNLGLGTPFAGNMLVYPIYRIDSTAYGVEGAPVEVSQTGCKLLPCYPNPSSGKVKFKYQLPKASKVTLSVYNIAGQVVKRMEFGTQPAGSHQAVWNADKMSAGVYFYQLQAGEFSATRKLVVLK